MPNIKVKTANIEKLKALGVYDAWLANVKDNWEEWADSHSNASEKISDESFTTFVHFSFNWLSSKEGRGFWHKIAYNKP